jgi:CRISPR type I-E-associated protein CasB/Cse2
MPINEFEVPMSKGDRALLKRSAGKTLAKSVKALGLFYSLKPEEVKQWEEEKYFTVLCIACLWEPDSKDIKLPFAECVKQLRKSHPTLDKRMENILATDWSDEDGFLSGKIAALARMIKTSDFKIKPDCAKLYQDLIYWNASNENVKKQWARIYYLSGKNPEEEEN